MARFAPLFAPALALILALAPAGASRLGAQAAVGARSVHGLDLAGMERSVKPGDDFFRYANGTWVRNTPIPPTRAAWGLDAMLDEQATMHTRGLLEEVAASHPPATSDQRKIGDYYRAYMNEAAIETRGLATLEPMLDRVAAIADRRALAQALGGMLRADVDPLNATNFHTDRLFGLFVAQDFNQPTRNTAYLLQGGLAMPDREYYLADSPSMADIRTRYRAHVVAVLTLAGVTGAQARADRIVDLETKIARVHWKREDSEDVHKANNVWTRASFDTSAPGLEWSTFFAAAGLDQQQTFLVWQPSAIAGESALASSEPLDVWTDYLRYTLLNHWSDLLPRAFAEEQFGFFRKVLAGTPRMPDRWKRAVASVNRAMGDAVGQLYVQRYFPPGSKIKAQAMVADLKAAFAGRLDRLDWISPEARAKAREKLENLIVGVGYPDRWRSYSSLEISPDDALLNAMRAEEYEYRRRIVELGQPIDRAEWWMTPQTVNAVNLPIQNALNFPAAILQPPYFDANAPAADNYGAIGAVIGHEISHSFDDQGSQFDASGRLMNWWKPEDYAHFTAATARLVAQYSAYHPLPDTSVNGQQTLSENIADVAGLSAAYDAYRLSLRGSAPPVRQRFTGDQQFFISFAQSWREKYREPLLRQILLTDGHSPSSYRADTVRNLDSWYAAFAVQPGAKLYLAPDDRVRIW
jgi:putative endopeptidase